MPDSLGRYQLQEMWPLVRRELNDATLTIDPITGDETTNPTYPAQSYSNTDITSALNYSMEATFQEMWTDHEEIFAQITYISISQNRPGPYALPFNMLKLRWLKIKPSSASLQSIQPDQWQPMVYYDEDLSQGIQNQFSSNRATWQRIGDNILLNWMPDQANENGIMVNSVIMPPQLVKPTDVVQSQFARPLQNFMIFDAAVHIGDTRQEQIQPQLLEQRQRAHDNLMSSVDNALQPPSVQIYSGRLVKTTFSGRWRGHGWGY